MHIHDQNPVLTAWAVMPRNADTAIAIFANSEEAIHYAMFLRNTTVAEIGVYPWTVPADVFDAE